MNLKSLIVHHTVGHTLYGILLILGGIFIFLFKQFENDTLGIFSISVLLLVSICLFWVIFVKTEKSDEMSHSHLQMAYVKAYNFERIIILALMILISFSKLFKWAIVIDPQVVLSILLGVGEIVIGFKFYKLEKDGEYMGILVTKIHELRRERNMQQAELAELVGVRRETIGNLENGKYNPSLKLAMDIAKVFDKSVEEVFMFKD